MSIASNFILRARQCYSVFKSSSQLNKSRSPASSYHQPLTPSRYTMGSSSPAPAFARLGETALFTPVELGKWNLQHRIVQVSNIKI